MKKLLICLCLVLVLAELSLARTRLSGSRRLGKTTKRLIVQIHKDRPKDEDLSQLAGQVTVDTDGLDEIEHPKLKKGQKGLRIPGRYIVRSNQSYSFFQVAGLLDTFYGAAQQRSSFQIRGATTMTDAFQGFTAQMNKEALETVSVAIHPLPFGACMVPMRVVPAAGDLIYQPIITRVANRFIYVSSSWSILVCVCLIGYFLRFCRF